MDPESGNPRNSVARERGRGVWSTQPGLGGTTRTLVVVGPGLLGGSFALAARAAGFGGRVVGVARRAATRDAALAAGVVDEATGDTASALAGADLAVLATPVDTYGPLMDVAASSLPGSATMLDLGSTKAAAVVAAEARLGARLPAFVPCHPMAGGTASGPAAAAAGLFAGRVVAVTPGPATDSERAAWVRGLWRSFGSVVLEMDPAEHDRQAAVVSHLPHVLAVCCRELAQAEGGIVSPLASTGFVGATRLANGDPVMRAAILKENRAAVLEAIDGFAAVLAAARARVDAGDAAATAAWLAAVRGERGEAG